MESDTRQLLVFTLDDRRYALYLDAVERVVRAVEVSPLPDAPRCVLGIINIKGEIVPVIDLRKRFSLPEKELHPGDRFIISSTPKRPFALKADAVHDVIGCPAEEIVPAMDITRHTGPVEGVVAFSDGMILISDPDMFLSPDEEAVLDVRLAKFAHNTTQDSGNGP